MGRTPPGPGMEDFDWHAYPPHGHLWRSDREEEEKQSQVES